jgi:hypothetical protein
MLAPHLAQTGRRAASGTNKAGAVCSSTPTPSALRSLAGFRCASVRPLDGSACVAPMSQVRPDMDIVAASGTPPALYRRTRRSNALCPLGLQDRIFRYCEYSTGSLGVYYTTTLDHSRGIGGHTCTPIVVVGLARGVCPMSSRIHGRYLCSSDGIADAGADQRG